MFLCSTAACRRQSATKNVGISTEGDPPTPFLVRSIEVVRPYEVRKWLVYTKSMLYRTQNCIQKLQFLIRSTVTGDTDILERMFEDDV